jgi:hypothetical protein
MTSSQTFNFAPQQWARCDRTCRDGMMRRIGHEDFTIEVATSAALASCQLKKLSLLVVVAHQLDPAEKCWWNC